MTPHTPPAASSHDTTVNSAGPGATVGVQAKVVHNVNVYQVPPGASPQEKFEAGLRYLNDGVPFKARELISEAIAAGHDNAEIRFHWVLAMFSKRSYRDLDRLERESLDDFANGVHTYTDGRYRSALEGIKELLAHLSGQGGDPDTAEKQILALDPELLALIQRHLELVLSGATKDKLWEATKERAKADRYASDRSSRVWAYFHPEPIRARARGADEPQIGPADRPRAMAATVLFALATGYLGWLLLSQVEVVALLAYLLAAATGYAGIRDASMWRYRTGRVRLEDYRNTARPAGEHLRGKGFAKNVSRSFEHYFAKYRPHGMDYAAWLAETAGVRGRLRVEIAEIYREQSTPIGRVNWLIGYLARDVRHCWQQGTLYDYRERYHVTLAFKARCMVTLMVMLAAGISVAVAAAGVAPVTASAAIVLAAFSGPYAAIRWQHIVSETRRYHDDGVEAAQRLQERSAAYQRWKAKLDATRPDETEMETWLHSDKTIMIDQALRHYRLSWRDVISHAVLQSPARRPKAGRARGGPWRYSRYDLRLFLITNDGVREVISELDFEHIAFNGQERNNFRFEALSSVNVTEDLNNSRNLNLTLTNGPTRIINVTDAEIMEPDPATVQSDVVDTPVNFLRMNLSAAGFTHALRILEGIAAEGKRWIDRDHHSPGSVG
ncbi:hypothetical protein [Glycomyces sp. NPDC048151]|uniref:hypothetical protein n=1 Tax=Glycomyces sp. NPDC048151 TaxID=3364002 RepID=UPI003713A551